MVRNGLTWSDVVNKFSYQYLRRLAIEHHIFELYHKMRHHISNDLCCFEAEDFNKELADLYLLLEMHIQHDKSFKDLVEQRKRRFIEKLDAERI